MIVDHQNIVAINEKIPVMVVDHRIKSTLTEYDTMVELLILQRDPTTIPFKI